MYGDISYTTVALFQVRKFRKVNLFAYAKHALDNNQQLNRDIMKKTKPTPQTRHFNAAHFNYFALCELQIEHASLLESWLSYILTMSPK